MDNANRSNPSAGVDANALYGQFLLVEDPAAPTPPGWATHQLDGWTLSAHPLLGVLPVRRAGGDDRPIGWLLGMAADPTGTEPRLIENELRLDVPADPAALDEAIERQLYRLGGRFACVLLAGDVRRMYLDACGTLATVYATRGPRRVASTTTLLAYPDLAAYRTRHEAMPRFEMNKFFPLGLTADDDSLRLLPNHYLDLNAWSAVRHWPTGPLERLPDANAEKGVARIAAAVRGTIVAIARTHPLALGLSAGRDSRMVLACARDVAGRFAPGSVFSFYYEGDRTRDMDVATARKICRGVGLPYRQLPLPTPPDEVRWEYLYRIGYSAHWGKANDFDAACRRHANLDGVLLTGFGGELGKLFYWRDEAAGGGMHATLSARDWLVRCAQEPSDRNVAAVERWLAGLPAGLDHMLVADLMYVELRLGCWSSAQTYGVAPFRGHVAPFAHRDAVAGTMALPPTFRREKRLAHALIAQTWPELNAWPFQQFTGFDALWRKGRKKLHNAKDKLRRLLSGSAPAAARPAAAAPRAR